jgi:Kef-type K+ transport system membrane component KefB
MNPQMIFSLWVLGILAATLAMVIGCYTCLVLTGFRRSNGGARALDTLTSRDGGLEFVTVAIVLPAAFVLRVNDWISADAAMTLISGVMGYVLGQYGMAKQKKKDSTESPPLSN